MILTINSNILLSIFANDLYCERAVTLMKKYRNYEYVINDIIYLELCVNFDENYLLDMHLKELDISLIEGVRVNYARTVYAWKKYLSNKTYTCHNCGNISGPVCPVCNSQVSFRQKILPDFLVADFALSHSDGILTFDPQHYRNYFPGLTIFE